MHSPLRSADHVTAPCRCARAVVRQPATGRLKKETRIGGMIRVSGEAGGGPHFTLLGGQRIRTAPATSATAQAAAKVFAEAVQLVTWCTVISGVPAWLAPWLWAWL